MKKKVIIALIIIGILAVLFTPIPTGVYKDGGTRVYSALTYKIVDWNRITGYSIYEKNSVYIVYMSGCIVGCVVGVTL